MNKDIKQYLSQIGKVGGKKSKRKLTPEQAKEMVRIREAKKLNLPEPEGEKERGG
jgi:hypothetical protein